MSRAKMKDEVKDDSPSDAAPALALRPIMHEDEQFLYEVYASTRADELAQVMWGEAQRETFLKMQLKARDQSYRMYYTEIDDRIILHNDERVGRLIVVRADEEIRLADIAVLPQHRGAGIASTLIKDLMAEARRSNKPIRLQVEKSNPKARSLYERLGFTTNGENVTHFQMEYRPVA